MKKLMVLQHTESEYLGLIEDHLEARRIGFQYLRPFVDATWQLKAFNEYDGLILLGGGPWGSAGDRNLPSLEDEMLICKKYRDEGKPILGFGLGAQILAKAAGGHVDPSPFEFSLLSVKRTETLTAEGLLPEEFPMVRYGRDWAAPPSDAKILARDEYDRPVVFQIDGNCFGFAGHPGVKSGIVEDLIMEFEETPGDVIQQLNVVRGAHQQIEKSLQQIMVGIVTRSGWMNPGSSTR